MVTKWTEKENIFAGVKFLCCDALMDNSWSGIDSYPKFDYSSINYNPLLMLFAFNLRILAPKKYFHSCVTVTRRVPLVEQELLTLPEYVSFLDHCFYFCPVSNGHCIVCPSIYRFDIFKLLLHYIYIWYMSHTIILTLLYIYLLHYLTRIRIPKKSLVIPNV